LLPVHPRVGDARVQQDAFSHQRTGADSAAPLRGSAGFARAAVFTTFLGNTSGSAYESSANKGADSAAPLRGSAGLARAAVFTTFLGNTSGSAYESSANNGLMYSLNVAWSQLATVAGVSARTEAVRGMCIASATSPK